MRKSTSDVFSEEHSKVRTIANRFLEVARDWNQGCDSKIMKLETLVHRYMLVLISHNG